jgi:hypothetical protein
VEVSYNSSELENYHLLVDSCINLYDFLSYCKVGEQGARIELAIKLYQKPIKPIFVANSNIGLPIYILVYKAGAILELGTTNRLQDNYLATRPVFY